MAGWRTGRYDAGTVVAGAERLRRPAAAARVIDFQPRSPHADAGSLLWDGEILVEQGRDIGYLQHWQRDAAGFAAPCASATLRRSGSGSMGLLLRVGAHFMFARDRATAACGHTSLVECVTGALSLQDARALIDCEISFGTVLSEGFLSEASTLPYRVGDSLAPCGSGQALATADRAPDGSHRELAWEIIDAEGNLGALGINSQAGGRFRRGTLTASGSLNIPVIDIGPLRAGDDRAALRVARELRDAATRAGAFYVTGHGLPESLFDDLLAVSKRFFAQSIEEKMKSYIGHSRNHRGYVPEGEEEFAGGTRDAKQAYDLARDLPVDDPDYIAGVPLLGPNQWPDVAGFKLAVDGYYKATFEIGRALMRGFALTLGEGADFFEPFLTKPPSQLRLIHHPYNPQAQDAPGIGAHTDYECFTLLRATGPGLEVMNETGAGLDAPPMANAYIVNIGDMLELGTNGEYAATSHRVRKVREERYSFPLFFAVDYQTRISPLPRFVGPGRPPRPGLVAGEHLLAQTAQTFRYLRRRLESGQLVRPQSSAALSSFGQQAKLGAARGKV